jgi:hypothetical protein
LEYGAYPAATAKEEARWLRKISGENEPKSESGDSLQKIEKLLEHIESTKLSKVPPSDDSKLITIKPPILVPELAARLGLKPFNVMADLIRLGIFPAPNQPIEPQIAEKVCEIHGFAFQHGKKS